ncbi:MAG: glycosyltransferase [Prochlorococcus marinus CUG1439]|uniref:glycosyltransferase n=1 Tax=Prochlorococcus sp. MIT 1314 TaxID=3096220 RepID=UPI001B212349|nr:glycosyltransferase [Prochlorococcus sp. MIT 1314]MCR8538805.1 glycosyltransferase [Prochlorococcus marinus CUG1439]
MKKFFIILPQDNLSGPIKGAVALANFLVNFIPTTIIFLRKARGLNIPLNNKVKVIYLNKVNFFSKVKKIQSIYFKNGIKENNISLSMCFSADLVNIFMNNFSITITSIRGNLIKNYLYNYKIFGFFLACIHLSMMRFHSLRIAMNRTMFSQVKFFSKKDVEIINNFIDEDVIKKYLNRPMQYNGVYKFCFVGLLTKRKGIESLIDAAHKIKNINYEIIIIGTGPLLKRMQNKVRNLHLENKIKFIGHKTYPYKYMSETHVMVLPSFSEGTSRAVLESLYMGIPCVLRNVDSNKDIINNDSNNVVLFDNDNELSIAMINLAQKSINRKVYNNLLPSNFSQNYCGNKYLNLINGIK